MSTLVQVSLVLIAAVQVVLVVAVILALKRLGKTADHLDAAIAPLNDLFLDAKQTSGEVRELVASLERVSASVLGIAGRFDAVSDRAAAVSSALLDQVEPPVRTVTALVQGVKAGAGMLLERWTERRRAARTNGG
jgi:uncharacterized protein YoxC